MDSTEPTERTEDAEPTEPIESTLLDAKQRRESLERIDQRAAMTLIHCRGAGLRPTLSIALRTSQP